MMKVRAKIYGRALLSMARASSYSLITHQDFECPGKASIQVETPRLGGRRRPHTHSFGPRDAK